MSIDRSGQTRVTPSAAGNYGTVLTGGWVDPAQTAHVPLSRDDFLSMTLGTFRLECPQGQHTYVQGEDAEGMEADELRKLLFCRGCGDIISFALPADNQ